MIQIAILGLGTVGTGVARVVAENARQIERKLGEPLQVTSILVRHFKDGPYRQLMTDDFTKIEEDHAIRVVVETIGGVEAAYEYTKRALNAGKHVVTANKQLVAEKGAELLALAKKQGVNYLFEASVGGGIPVLHPLTQCMAANRIDEVYGILNGTTNYILTRMVRAGTTFADALKEAQEKGYAEADPTADVEGVDAGRKICILADLAFGCQVDPADVPMEGISRLSLRDVKIAQRAGYRVKLLGRAVRLPGGRTAYVAPHLIPEERTRRALRTRRPFGAGTTSASAAASAPLPRPSARWRSSARTAVRPPSSPTASAEPRQGSRPKACASWPVCGCWDKPQTAGRCVYWNRREPGFET